MFKSSQIIIERPAALPLKVFCKVWVMYGVMSIWWPLGFRGLWLGQIRSGDGWGRLGVVARYVFTCSCLCLCVFGGVYLHVSAWDLWTTAKSLSRFWDRVGTTAPGGWSVVGSRPAWGGLALFSWWMWTPLPITKWHSASTLYWQHDDNYRNCYLQKTRNDHKTTMALLFVHFFSF